MSTKVNRYLYAIRRQTLQPHIQLIGSSHQHFSLAIGGAVRSGVMQGVIVQQQTNKFGQYLFAFDIGQKVRLHPQQLLVGLPLSCAEEDGRYFLLEEQVRRFVFQFKALIEHDDSDDSDQSKISQSAPQISSVDHRCRGRPKGTRNRRHERLEKSSEEEFMEEGKKVQEKRGRGRPKGAKNIKKQQIATSEAYWNQLNVYEMFVTLFEAKSIEEVNTRISRLKERDERLLFVKKQEMEGEQLIKRSRGRPKGVKNKPKLNNQESDSQMTIQFESLPKRKGLKHGGSLKCCLRCEQMDLKRLFIQGNYGVLLQMVNLQDHISVDNHANVILFTIKQGHVELLRNLLSRKHQTLVPFVLSWDCTNRLEDAYYTVRTRREFIAKQKKQGINALIQDALPKEGTWWQAIGLEPILQSLPHTSKGIQIYCLLVELEPELRVEIDMNIATIARCGNESLTSYLLQKVLKQAENTFTYGYSQLHCDVLSKKKSQLTFKKAAMLKQSCTANFCSPIHCAILNSNYQLLSFILKHATDLNVGDSMGRKPIHYAAVMETSRQLEMLVKLGGDLREIDKHKVTPLMLAAKYGRLKNLRFILEKVRDGGYINFRNQEGLAALHYAIVEKHSQCVELLLGDSLTDKEIQTREGMNAFHLAASTGQKQLLKLLIEDGGSPEPDHFRRTPLMLAIRNHQNDCFFYLFQCIQRYYGRDHSYNTMLHYAAAYGNQQIVKYLLEIHQPQIMNRRRFYPFEIAVLKGHYQCARLLENWGLHFSHHLINKLSKHPRGTQEFYRMFQYLLQSRKYDLNYNNPAALGYTCLHFVCALGEQEYSRLRQREGSIAEKQEFGEMQRRLINLLLRYGADPAVENDKGEKPLKLCIENENMVGIQLLLQTIPFELQGVGANSYIYYLTKIGCLGWKEMEFVYQKLLSTEARVLKLELRKVDANGFQFLIYLVKKFTESVHHNFEFHYRQAVVKAGNNSSQAITTAFELYLRHQDILIKTINHLVDMGADPKFTVSEPRMDEEYENYKKWGIQHFLMRFPSPNLLRIFMKWIDTNFNLQNSEGRTPLHLFCMWNSEGSIFKHPGDQLPVIAQHQMRQFEGSSCLEYLLQNGLTSNVLDINRSTPLLYAAIRNQLHFIRLLRNFGSTINNINSLNQVPLIELIRQKNILTTKQVDTLLADEGIRVDFPDMNNRNVLHHLVSVAQNFDNSPEICRKLMLCGVGINSLDKYGRSPVFYCFIKIEENQSSNEDSNDKVQILQTLMSNESIDLGVVDIYSRTPLHYACEQGFFFSILYLLKKWREVDRADSDGNTPLAICLKNRNLNQAAMLIKRGVNYGWVVEEGCRYSYIQYGLKCLPLGICFMLVEHGYPLDKALQESGAFREVFLKKYSK